MARRIREAYAGATYHVYSRGNRGSQVFCEPGEYAAYLRDLERIGRESDARVFAFCLMPNHPHLCLRTEGDSISQVMQRLNLIHARRYNRIHGVRGHLNEARFQSKVVDNLEYLLELIRYIHQNPVCAGLARNVGQWPYSSHQAYVGDAFPWVAKEEVIQRFGGLESYLLAMAKRQSPEECEAFEVIARPRPADLPPLPLSGNRPLQRGPRGDHPPEQPIEQVAARLLGVSQAGLAALAAGPRRKPFADLRRNLALQLRERGYRLHDIGALLGREQAAVCKLLQRAREGVRAVEAHVPGSVQEPRPVVLEGEDAGHSPLTEAA